MMHSFPITCRLLIPATLMLSLITGCSKDSVLNDEPELGEEVRIAIDRNISIAGSGLNIEFSDVSEDSRCPSEVECVWEGNARIELLINGAEFTLHTSPSVGSQTLRYNDFRVDLIRLEPYPDSPGQPNRSEYSIVIVVNNI